jgi:site-specific DNA recombinase
LSPRIRIAFSAVSGRQFRVLIYARYSTDEQHPSSIADQVAYCKDFLQANGLRDADIVVQSDAEMSGELVSRPGINQVRERVRSRWPDLLVCEDSSRLFRHETACGELIETAVDLNIRVIAINDGMDTAEEDWDDRLHEAAHHHARANKYTSRRIKRKLEGLWRMGAAIGLLRPGYQRQPTVAATPNEPAQGPYFDAKDPRWESVIYETYERMARHDPPWLVAEWLTAEKLPKCANASKAAWTDRNVISLIQRPIYRGWDTYRITFCRKERRSGKSKQVRNEPDLVLTRNMEHLRIVPDWLWHNANEPIKERTLRPPGPTGLDHPLTGIPRDSRGPLANLFFCAICKGKMYKEGQSGAQYRAFYRCSNAVHGSCWNKATAQQDLVHVQIGQAVIAKLLSLDGVLDAVVAHVQHLFQEDKPRKAQRAELEGCIREGELACKRLLDAIEQAKEPPGLLLDRLRHRQEEAAAARTKLVCLDEAATAASPPTLEQIRSQIETMTTQFLAMDREAGVLLRPLAGPIWAVPCQQFGGKKVVLRAQFELRLAALFPEQVFAALQGYPVESLAQQLLVIPMMVDLFKRSAGPLHFAEALRLSRTGRILEEIGQQLGIAKRQAHIAVQYGKALAAAGLTDPFLPLEQPPNAVSRWRQHPRFRQAD